MTGEMLEGQRLGAHTAIWPCWGVLLVGFSWSLFLAHRCDEEKACFAPILRRAGGKSTTQLIHGRGPPLVFVAGEQGHGGAYVFASRAGSPQDRRACGTERSPSGQNWTDTNFAHGRLPSDSG